LGHCAGSCAESHGGWWFGCLLGGLGGKGW
jgi:hypothetical protein